MRVEVFPISTTRLHRASFPAFAAAGLGLALVISASVSAVAADALERLDQALKAVPAFEYGKDGAPLTAVERIVVEAAKNPALRAEVEGRLLETLRGPATRDAKEFLCRQLFTIGTAKCVPVLEPLLEDPALSHMARFALGRNEDPAAAEAMYRALGKTSGRIQAGIINTLGDRHYQPAVQDLQKLLGAGEPIVAEAAATALGKIGTPEALTALAAARANAAPNVARRIDEARLLAADHLLAAHQPEDAIRIYETFYSPSQPRHLRLAGLRGLLAADAKEVLPSLVEAVRGSDPALRSEAIGLSRTGGGEPVTRALAELLAALPPETQEQLLGALAGRNDPAALPAVLATAGNSSGAVRVAAYDALGAVGDASVVETLVAAAAAGAGPEQQAARSSLLRLNRGDVTQALLAAMTSTEPNRQIEAVRAIAGRRAASAAGNLLELARTAQGPVRREATKALGVLVGQTSLAPLVALAGAFSDPDDLAELEQAVAAAFQRVTDPEKQAAPLIEVCRTAPAVAQPALLRLLSRTGTPSALAAIRTALGDQNPGVRDAALRALADWPDGTPAEELLTQARDASIPRTEVLALRGFVRMAGLSKDPGAMYAHAMEVAQRPEDKKLVLASLGAAEPIAAMKLVEPCLQDEQLRAEAASAAFQIADRLRQKDLKRAKALARAALAVTTDPDLLQKGRGVMDRIEEFDDFILDWVACGPFSQKDKDARGLFDLVLPPEHPGAPEVKWTRVTKGIGNYDINLADALGGADDVVAYARTRLWSPRDEAARFEFGSDDGLKAWLNDTVIDAQNVERGLGPRQDTVKADLKEGWNVLLLKITNRSGGWGFCCRIRRPDGAAIEGLRVQSE